jgi:hypothetical protein
MACSPVGVAIGVSGEQHDVHGNPTVQVPEGVGSWHFVKVIAALTLQQSWPGEQQASAQQKLPVHDPASIPHGGIEH